MTALPIERVRGRLGELGVAQIRVDRDGIPFRDYSPDRIDVHALTNGFVELWDREGHSWIGSADAALAALADLHQTEDPVDVWMRLARA